MSESNKDEKINIENTVPADEAANAAEADTVNSTSASEADSADKAPQPDADSEADAVKSELEAVKKELEGVKNTLLRTAAEYDNFRKRTAKEKDAAFGNGVAHAAERILCVLDTLTLAAEAPTSDEEYKKGVTMTLNKAREAFDALDIKEIDALGKEFDPNTMAAVMQQPAKEGEAANTVVQVFQKGYLRGDKVIRHASVVVTV